MDITPEQAADAVVVLFTISLLLIIAVRGDTHRKKVAQYKQRTADMIETRQTLIDLVLWEKTNPYVSKTHPQYQELLNKAIEAFEMELTNDMNNKEIHFRLFHLKKIQNILRKETLESCRQY